MQKYCSTAAAYHWNKFILNFRFQMLVASFIVGNAKVRKKGDLVFIFIIFYLVSKSSNNDRILYSHCLPSEASESSSTESGTLQLPLWGWRTARQKNFRNASRKLRLWSKMQMILSYKECPVQSEYCSKEGSTCSMSGLVSCQTSEKGVVVNLGRITADFCRNFIFTAHIIVVCLNSRMNVLFMKLWDSWRVVCPNQCVSVHREAVSLYSHFTRF